MSLIFLTSILAISIAIFQYLHQRKKSLAVTKHFFNPPRTALGVTEFYENIMYRYFTEFFTIDSYKIFHSVMEFPTKYAKNTVVWALGNYYELLITHPDDLETIFTSKSTVKGDTYNYLKPWLGEGLLTSSGDKWFNRRKIITPTFHFKILEQFLEVFNEQDTKLVQKLKKYAENDEECNIYDHLTRVALDNICETAMGVKINAQDNPNSEYIQAIKDMGDIILRRLVSLLHQFPRLWAFTPAARKMKKVLKYLHGFTDKVINEKRKKLESQKGQVQNNNDEEDEFLGKKPRLSFLDMLLRASTVDGEPLSDLDIREEVDTFMFEGHDTTTSAMTFAMYNLAMHPEVQERAFEELRKIMGDDPSSDCSYNDLQEMKYLDKVIKENLRLYPSVSFITRKTIEPMKIQGVEIPIGTNLNIPIYAINRNPETFEEPHKFDPERFEGEKERSWGPFDYIPFSAGQRNCIGQKFAMLEMKSIISTILRNYKVVATEKTRNMKFESDIVIRCIGGLTVKLEQRKY